MTEKCRKVQLEIQALIEKAKKDGSFNATFFVLNPRNRIDKLKRAKGYVSLTVSTEKRSTYISEMYIRKKEQGQALGSKLMHLAACFARKHRSGTLLAQISCDGTEEDIERRRNFFIREKFATDKSKVSSYAIRNICGVSEDRFDELGVKYLDASLCEFVKSICDEIKDDALGRKSETGLEI